MFEILRNVLFLFLVMYAPRGVGSLIVWSSFQGQDGDC